MIEGAFTVLIGSVARGTHGPDSDVDILRIGHERELRSPLYLPVDMHVSFVDYDKTSFIEFYSEGSLFLYHAFAEGQLLEGDAAEWDRLRKRFEVSKDFSEAISDYTSVLDYISSYPSYERAYIAYLSNVFKALKNIAIFRLAEAGHFQFDKINALSEYFSLSRDEASLLVASNNSFERNRHLDGETREQLKEFALTWRTKNQGAIRRLCG